MRLGAVAWRGLAARPLRTALTAVGIALGVAIVAATLIANQAAEETVERAARELLGRADLRVRAFSDEGFTPRSVAALRGLNGVRAAAPVAERRLTVSTEPGPQEQVFSLLVIGLDPALEPAIRDHPMASGDFLPVDDPYAALVSARWAAQHRLEIGDRLLLIGRRLDTPPVTIVGLLQETGMGAMASGSVLVMHRATLSDAFEVPAPIRYVDLDVAEGQLSAVERSMELALAEPFVVESVGDARERLARPQASFAGIAFLFGLVSLVVGGFLVTNTLAMSATERTREIGLLRAAGTTTRQVIGLFLRQGAAIGLAGSILGLMLGVALAAAMIWFLGTRAVLIGSLPLSLASLAVAFGLGMVVSIAGSLTPALTAARISPLDALRPSRQPGRTLWGRLRWILILVVLMVLVALAVYPLDRGDASIAQLLVAGALLIAGTALVAYLLAPLARLAGQPLERLFGAEGRLGRANLGRDRPRTGLTVGALMVALAAVVVLGAVSETTRSAAERWVGSIMPGGHAIRLGMPVSIDQLAPAFENTPGTRVASPIVEFPAVLLEAGAPREVSLAGIDPSVFDDTRSLIFVEGERRTAFDRLREGGAVLVPEPLARREGIAVGDRLALALPGFEGSDFRVAGLIAYTLPARSPDGALLVSLGDARDRFAATNAALWAMVPHPDEPAAAYRTSVGETARSLAGEPLTARDLASDLSLSLDRLLGLFDGLALIAVVIATFGIVNTLGAGVRERLREIAILRANGMTAAQVQAMVVSEAAIMGLVAGMAAVVTGLLVAWGMIALGTPDSLGIGLAIPWALMASVVLLGVGVAIVASVYPARQAGRQSIVGHIQHFE
jgi:putative ABC transport system permease protein